MTISIAPLHPLFVAEVSGVDLTDELSVDEFAKIHAAFDRHAVLVFRGQRLTDEQQLTFSRRFGVLETAPNYAGKAPRLGNAFTDISNLDAEGRVLNPEDRLTRYNLGNQLWHTDSSFKARRAKCSLLSAREVCRTGGETQYADLRSAYDALPDRRKADLADLVAMHSIAHSRSLLGFEEFNSDITTTLPPVPQRMVDYYPDSDRTSLYIASHASHVLGLPIDEGRGLLTELIEFATAEQFVYTQNWTVGDLVIWDNRATMHRGRPYDLTERRVLHRSTVSDTVTSFEERATPEQRRAAAHEAKTQAHV